MNEHYAVFEFNASSFKYNETGEQHYDHHGYDGTTGAVRHVVVPLSVEEAVEWWKGHYDRNPRRHSEGVPTWTVVERPSANAAAAELPSKTVEGGGIGSVHERPRSLDEASADDDVLVVEDPDYDI